MSWIASVLEKARAAIGRNPQGRALVRAGGEDWNETVIAGLTPARMAIVLRDAATGAADEFLALAAELEETDPHYRAVLSTRKLAVAGLEPDVEAACDDARDQKIAQFVKDVISAPAFAGLVLDLLDGLGKGYAAAQIVWDTSGDYWRPARYEWIDPRAFRWDPALRRLRQRDGNDKLRDPEAFRFIFHVPRLISGAPVRGALARVCAWSLLYKNYALKDWMRFLDVYGMPVRVGKYTATATEEDKRKLLRALYALGSDAAAVVPASASIEFVQPSSGSSSAGPVFGHMAEYIDRQLSKAVLGQTMTTDNGSSLAQARVHAEVRADVLRADARQLAASINHWLIRPLVALNFGELDRWPVFTMPVIEAEDIRQWTEATTAFMDRGLGVSRRQIMDRLGLDEPETDEDRLSGGKSGDEPRDNSATARRHAKGCPCCSGRGRALASAGPDPMDEIGRMVEEALPETEENDPMLPLAGPLREALFKARDYDDLRARLEQAASDMDAGALSGQLGRLSFLARAIGDGRDEP